MVLPRSQGRFWRDGRRPWFGRALVVGILSFPGTSPLTAQTARAPRLPTPIPAESLVVSTEWLAARLRDPMVVVLHVAHDADEYERDHIPGARFLSMMDVVTDANRTVIELPPAEQLAAVLAAVGVSDGSRVVLYGEPMHVGRAFLALEYVGHGRTSVLDGGVRRWRAEGRPTSRARPSVARGSLTVRARPDVVADAEWVRAHLGAPRIALIDTRSVDEYRGSERGEGGARGLGHLAGARRLAWQDVLAGPPSELTLRDRGELRKLFQRLGADPGDTVVTYCRVGMRASVSYLVARWLGFPTRIYDGSWVDWSARGLPVVRGDDPR